MLAVACLLGFAVQCAGFYLFVAPAFALADTRAQALVEVTSVQPGFVEGTVRVRLRLLELDGTPLGVFRRTLADAALFPDCEPGQRFRVELELSALTADEYFYGSLADGVCLEAECLDTPVEAGRSDDLLYAARRLQAQLAAGIARYLPRAEGGTLAAMASGDRTRLTDQVTDDYQAAGMSHLLVVSGLHLSLLCGVFAPARGAGARWRRLRYLLAIALVVFMMALTGFTPSVVRAGIAALITYAGGLLLLAPDPLTSLGVAALLISFQGPYAVCDLAFQLSFAATLGVAVANVLLQPLRQRTREKGDIGSRLAAGAAGLVLPTLLAAAFTLPVQLLGGLPVSGVSLLANLLALRFVGAAVIMGMLAGLCSFSPWLDFAGRAFSLAGGLLAKLLNAIAAFCADLPLARLPLPREYSLVCFAALVLVIVAAVRLKCARWLWGALPALVVLCVLWGGFLQQDTVEISLVGSGTSPCVVAVENGQALVLFRGGQSNAEAVEECLGEMGVLLPQLTVDLRAEPAFPAPEAEKTVELAALPVLGSQKEAVCDIMVTTVRLKTGGLVLLEIAGCRVAVPTGRVVTGTPLRTDYLLTGNTDPGELSAQTLVTRVARDWQAGREWKVYYAPRGVRLLIRPGRSAVLQGGRYAL